MIGQYLPNNNENTTVTFCQKIRHPNGALVAGFRGEDEWAESVRLARREDVVGRIGRSQKEKGAALVPLQCH
jgi:hypothetical protein